MTGNNTSAPFWAGLQAMASGAGLKQDWQWAFGPAYDLVEPFLAPTTEVAESYPCTADPPCGCRHTLRDADDQLAAVCTCGSSECDTFFVPPEAAVAWKLDLDVMGNELSKALGLEPPAALREQPGAIRDLGRPSSMGQPVRWTIARFETVMRELLAATASDMQTPFVLLVPWESWPMTALNGIRAELTILQLHSVIQAGEDGKFRPTSNGQELLKHASELVQKRTGSDVLRAVRRELASIRKAVRNPRSRPEPLPDDVAQQLFAVLKELEPAGQARKAPVLQVFRLYCIEGLTPEQIARRCGCSRPLIVLRLQQIERKLGRHPAELRVCSAHIERIEDSLTDSRARHIHRKHALYGESGPD